MGKRWSWVAWSILTLSIVPVAAGFFLVVEGNAALVLRGETTARLDLSQELFARLAFIPFGIVGAIIVARQPHNAIGWLCSAIGVGTSLFQFMEDYAYNALAGDLPGGVALATLGASPWAVLLGLIAIYLPLLFPTGRLPSPRWRPVAWAAAVVVSAASILFAVQPIRLFEIPSFPVNPFGIEGAAATIELAASIVTALVGLLALLAAVSVVIRFRLASGVERQQLKWFSYAATLPAAFFAIGFGLPSQGLLFECCCSSSSRWSRPPSA